jgi:hypothetical protein
MAPAEVDPIVSESDRRDTETLTTALGKRFMQGRLTDKHRQILRDYLGSRTEIEDQDVRNAIRLLMCTPEYQVT